MAINKALTVHEQDLYPEGIAYSAKLDTIFVSSMKYGKIGTVSSTGEYADFIRDDETFVSISGIYVDDMHDRLIVSNVDPGAGERTRTETQGALAGIAIYDINTKERLAYHPLHELYEGGHFSNEITVAKRRHHICY